MTFVLTIKTPKRTFETRVDDAKRVADILRAAQETSGYQVLRIRGESGKTFEARDIFVLVAIKRNAQ